jgi:hypothetical protein
LIHQVASNPSAPQVENEPDSQIRVPLVGREWECGFPSRSRNLLQATLETPLNVPLSAFARKIQAVRILGWVQMLPKLTDSECFYSQIEMIDDHQIELLKIVRQGT